MQEVDSYTVGQLKEAYDQYLKIELATPSKSSIIYDNVWCVRTGRSFASPHPHRYFKFDEFVKCGMDDSILFSSFMI